MIDHWKWWRNFLIHTWRTFLAASKLYIFYALQLPTKLYNSVVTVLLYPWLDIPAACHTINASWIQNCQVNHFTIAQWQQSFNDTRHEPWAVYLLDTHNNGRDHLRTYFFNGYYDGGYHNYDNKDCERDSSLSMTSISAPVLTMDTVKGTRAWEVERWLASVHAICMHVLQSSYMLCWTSEVVCDVPADVGSFGLDIQLSVPHSASPGPVPH